MDMNSLLAIPHEPRSLESRNVPMWDMMSGVSVSILFYIHGIFFGVFVLAVYYIYWTVKTD